MTISLNTISVLQITDVPVIDPRLLTHIHFATVENQSEEPAAPEVTATEDQTPITDQSASVENTPQ